MCAVPSVPLRIDAARLRTAFNSNLRCGLEGPLSSHVRRKSTASSLPARAAGIGERDGHCPTHYSVVGSVRCGPYSTTGPMHRFPPCRPHLLVPARGYSRCTARRHTGSSAAPLSLLNPCSTGCRVPKQPCQRPSMAHMAIISSRTGCGSARAASAPAPRAAPLVMQRRWHGSEHDHNHAHSHDHGDEHGHGHSHAPHVVFGGHVRKDDNSVSARFARGESLASIMLGRLRSEDGVRMGAVSVALLGSWFDALGQVC